MEKSYQGKWNVSMEEDFCSQCKEQFMAWHIKQNHRALFFSQVAFCTWIKNYLGFYMSIIFCYQFIYFNAVIYESDCFVGM
jgi:hypothetical protein